MECAIQGRIFLFFLPHPPSDFFLIFSNYHKSTFIYIEEIDYFRALLYEVGGKAKRWLEPPRVPFVPVPVPERLQMEARARQLFAAAILLWRP